LRIEKLLTLLLVSANPIVRTFFEKVIDQAKDYSLILAANRFEGLECLQKTEIDCIVIDENTIDIDLRSFCEEIKEFEGSNKIPILIITGNLKKSFIRELIQVGVSDFLREPLDKDELFLRIEIARDIIKTRAKISTLTSLFSKETNQGLPLEKRVILDDQAMRLIRRALTEKIASVLMILEIDQYPQIVEAHGEQIGRFIILACGKHLQKLMRPQDMLCNQSHGKFVIFLPNTSSAASGYIAENMMKSLEKKIFSASNLDFVLTLSIGIATLEQAADPVKNIAINIERLIKNATEALNKAKEKTNSIISYKKS